MNRAALFAALLALLGLTACGDEDEALPPTTHIPTRFAAEVRTDLTEENPPPLTQVSPEQIAAAKAHGVPVSFVNGRGMRFVLIPSGTFLMGAPESESGRHASEHQHEVTISRPFYIQTTEVTRGQYGPSWADVEPFELRRQASAPSFPGNATEDSRKGGTRGRNQPATVWSWTEARGFAAWLSSLDLAREYRLPTEAEWEYACRAGTVTAFAFGETLTARQANFGVGATDRDRELALTPAARFPANDWALHDMHGNVAEYCEDGFEYFTTDTVRDPRGLQSAEFIVVRGGDSYAKASQVRSAARGRAPPLRRSWPTLCGIRLVSPIPNLVESK